MDWTPYRIAHLGRWDWYVHKRQFHLGRSYLWLATPEPEDRSITSLDEGEWSDLGDLIVRLSDLTISTFGAGRVDWANLQNEAHHLHVHLIPRYSGGAAFGDLRIPPDPCFEDIYSEHSLYKRFHVPDRVVLAVGARLRDALHAP